MKLSATIILPNYNNERVLPFTFKYLREYVDCTKVGLIMVDDGSEDSSVNVAKTEVQTCGFAYSEIIEQEHKGIVPSLNVALDAVRTEIVIRIDGDATIESPGWVNHLVQFLRNEEVGLVGGQVLWESNRVHSFGRSVFTEFGLHDMGCVPVEPVGRRTYDSLVYRPYQSFLKCAPYEVDTILGVCVAFRKEDAQAVGNFDMRFNPVWIEDDDFGLKIRRLGKRVIVDPRVCVTHRPSLRGSRQPGKTRGLNSQQIRKQFSLQYYIKGVRSRLVGCLDWLKGSSTEIEYYLPREVDPWRIRILNAHYREWKTLWGFDPINPNLLDFLEKYWETPLCWRANPRQLADSKRFLKSLIGNLT